MLENLNEKINAAEQTTKTSAIFLGINGIYFWSQPSKLRVEMQQKTALYISQQNQFDKFQLMLIMMSMWANLRIAFTFNSSQIIRLYSVLIITNDSYSKNIL